MRSPEAFKRMLYQCEVCRAEEWIWNSRDGVTPFCVDCRVCGQIARHIAWHLDRRLDAYVPAKGERFFRDGLPEEAASIMRRRIAQMRDEYPLTDEEAERMITDAAAATRGESTDPFSEFQPGWPMLVIAGTDQA